MSSVSHRLAAMAQGKHNPFVSRDCTSRYLLSHHLTVTSFKTVFFYLATLRNGLLVAPALGGWVGGYTMFAFDLFSIRVVFASELSLGQGGKSLGRMRYERGCHVTEMRSQHGHGTAHGSDTWARRSSGSWGRTC